MVLTGTDRENKTLPLELELQDPVFGDVVYPPGGTCGPRRQRFYQLFIVLQGAATVMIDGNPFPIPAGHTILLRPDHDEFFQFAHSQPTRHSYAHFPVRRISAELLELIPKDFLCLPLTRGMEELMSLGLSLGLARDPLSQLQRSKLAESLFMECIHACQIWTRSVPIPPPAVQRVQSLIERHFNQPLDLAKLAREAHLTPTHLIRLFRQYVGMTPIRYVWHIRQTHGVELLRSTGLSVAEVAMQTGFQSAAHFSSVVKKFSGLPPAELRKKFWR